MVAAPATAGFGEGAASAAMLLGGAILAGVNLGSGFALIAGNGPVAAAALTASILLTLMCSPAFRDPGTAVASATGQFDPDVEYWDAEWRVYRNCCFASVGIALAAMVRSLVWPPINLSPEWGVDAEDNADRRG